MAPWFWSGPVIMCTYPVFPVSDQWVLLWAGPGESWTTSTHTLVSNCVHVCLMGRDQCDVTLCCPLIGRQLPSLTVMFDLWTKPLPHCKTSDLQVFRHLVACSSFNNLHAASAPKPCFSFLTKEGFVCFLFLFFSFFTLMQRFYRVSRDQRVRKLNRKSLDLLRKLHFVVTNALSFPRQRKTQTFHVQTGNKYSPRWI